MESFGISYIVHAHTHTHTWCKEEENTKRTKSISNAQKFRCDANANEIFNHIIGQFQSMEIISRGSNFTAVVNSAYAFIGLVCAVVDKPNYHVYMSNITYALRMPNIQLKRTHLWNVLQEIASANDFDSIANNELILSLWCMFADEECHTKHIIGACMWVWYMEKNKMLTYFLQSFNANNQMYCQLSKL